MGCRLQVVVVLSGSMEPGFYRGDILFLHMGRKPVRAGEVSRCWHCKSMCINEHLATVLGLCWRSQYRVFVEHCPLGKGQLHRCPLTKPGSANGGSDTFAAPDQKIDPGVRRA